MSKNPLLEVKHLTKVFTGRGLSRGRSLTAVDDLSFEMPEETANVTALVGESGSGKTTTGLLILGMTPITSGQIIYREKSIREMTKEEWTNYRKEVQAVFQDPYEVYNPFYKVDRVLGLPIRNFRLASSDEEAHKLITEALDAVNLTPEEALGKYPHQLSGGQRQRLMIARALLTRPRLIVADEPVSMVDASLRAGILNTMLDLKRAYNISFIFITHDLSVADYFSDDIIVLYRGSNVESGDIKKVLKSPAHPYLQLLVSSIPLPDPERRWTERTTLKAEEITQRRGEGTGCKFYSRCPKASDICASTRPTSILTDTDHFVACHLCSEE